MLNVIIALLMQAVAWVAPAEQASKPNPLASRPHTAAGGAKVFRQRCTTCHGDDGRGTTKAPDLTGPDVQQQSDGALFWKISSGNTHAGMPAFSFLPDLQRWQLVLHVRSLGRAETRSDHAMFRDRASGTSRSGRSVISASTPHSSSRRASASASTVHTCTPSPTRCAYSTKRGETTRVRPANSGI